MVQARQILPASGELDDLVAAFAELRQRPVHLMPAALGDGAISGLWVSTDRNDYIVYPHTASPERQCAIVCHEIGHALLGHEKLNLADVLIDSGAFAGLSPDLVKATLAARHGYDRPEERDAELVGTHLANELRFRLDRGGDRFSDERWD